MADIGKLTLKIDPGAVAALFNRIEAFADVVSEEEATALSDCADELVSQCSLFLLHLDKATDTVVMEIDPEFLARVEALEVKYGL